MKCFFHSADLDGACSGAIIKNHTYPQECEMIGINHGDPFPWKDLVPGETVFMADFSLQPFDRMVKLNEIVHLIWIDHHKSAIDEYDRSGINISGMRKIGIGACRLVWDFLYPVAPIPTTVQLLAEYDVFNHENPMTLPFQYGMRAEKDTFPDNQTFWRNLFNGFGIQEIADKGDLIMQYIDADNAKYCSACAFETEFEGLKVVAINRLLVNSKVFDSVWDPEKYDAMIAFGIRKGKWTVHLYHDEDKDLDLGAIAKAHGGGGHKGAAGFQCPIDELPFEIPTAA